ncbi:MAG TPA: hydrogenase subunit MbhD domain-containing protein [Rubrobacteraceae bacterium]|nr:hydrogenase subunit MbhD domain-containing protein [Rubrobacteraceae bacterium]
MTVPGFLFDALLAAALPLLAWRAISARELFAGVVVFISFGLLVALAWVRLGAPDIALAEAAIGAGLTGALFLNTIGRLNTSGSEETDERGEPAERRSKLARALVAPATLGLGLALAWSLLSLPEPPVGLGERVGEAIPRSGVSHPVTAVLLNFRSYDTLLEVGVLLLAIVAVWALRLPRYRREEDPGPARAPVLAGLVRLLAPVMVLVTCYLLWAGTTLPGGAFQAGAVLGALGVLLLLANMLDLPAGHGGALRLGLAVGFGVFIAVGAAALLAGRVFLDYPPQMTYGLILLVEAVLTLSIGLTLAALFYAAPPEDER